MLWIRSQTVRLQQLFGSKLNLEFDSSEASICLNKIDTDCCSFDANLVSLNCTDDYGFPIRPIFNMQAILTKYYQMESMLCEANGRGLVSSAGQ
ncbi:hypothetical protein FGO68_gene9454 [Halteria grandinella]|uniref:Uncharacterized protein n=1 Tax=Halteria grandinella TaxID=5974 RepID=A0A8J8P8Q1_HALGN|nr:hypothetical protein FGO68_gene9454 [Halteria grandinella]